MLISKSGAFAKSLLETLGADGAEHPERPNVHTATTAVTIIAVIQNRPVGSFRFTGLFPQYTNILYPRTPCPVDTYPSALINRPTSGS